MPRAAPVTSAIFFSRGRTSAGSSIALARAVTVIGCAVTNADRADSTKRSTGSRRRSAPRADEDEIRGGAEPADLLRHAPHEPVERRLGGGCLGRPVLGRSREHDDAAGPGDLRDQGLEELVDAPAAPRGRPRRSRRTRRASSGLPSRQGVERAARGGRTSPPARRRSPTAPEAASRRRRRPPRRGTLRASATSSAPSVAPTATRASASGRSFQGPRSRTQRLGQGNGQAQRAGRARERAGSCSSSRRKSVMIVSPSRSGLRGKRRPPARPPPRCLPRSSRRRRRAQGARAGREKRASITARRVGSPAKRDRFSASIARAKVEKP